MNITVTRGTGDKPFPEPIVDELLVRDDAGRARAMAELNENSTDRKIVTAEGTKHQVLTPGKLVEIVKRGKSVRGILKMYSRSYNRGEDGKTITINSSVEIEVQA